jgi:hypothetical protein
LGPSIPNDPPPELRIVTPSEVAESAAFAGHLTN